MREGWKEVRLDEIANVTMGLSPKGETYNDQGIGLPLLNGPTEFGETYPNCTLFTTDSKRVCLAGDLIFCVRGSTTGRMNWADKAYSLGRGVCAISGTTKFETIFLKHYLTYNLDKLLKITGGGTFPNLRTEDIKGFQIILPKEYKKIASILSGYDDLIENNLKRIKILEEMAQQTYEEWFVRMRFPGHQSATMNPETGLPEGWEKVKLSSIYELKYGKNLPQTQILQAGAFNVYGASGKMGFYDKNNVNDKKVLVTSRGNGSGVVHRTHEKKSFVTNNSFIVNSKFKLGYTYYNLKHFDLSRFNSGSAQPQLTNSALDYVEIILPKVDIIFAFDENTCKSFELIDNLLIQNQRLREARDILLPRLMMGMVEV